jgi:hypothetical protein
LEIDTTWILVPAVLGLPVPFRTAFDFGTLIENVPEEGTVTHFEAVVLYPPTTQEAAAGDASARPGAPAARATRALATTRMSEIALREIIRYFLLTDRLDTGIDLTHYRAKWSLASTAKHEYVRGYIQT